jgi:hypothetical protein
MKNNLRNFALAATLFLSFSCMVTTVFGQAPQKIGFQGVVRNASNVLVTSTTVGMQISILQGATPVYVETQTPTTDINGLATIQIGNGTVISGTMAGIDWSAGPYSIQTETDPLGGTAYTITSTSELLSVPYALFAANPGPTGATGNGIASTIDNGNGTFTINYTDGTSFTTSDLTGPIGTTGPQGPAGPTGPQGPAGVLSVNCLECHNHDRNGAGYEGSFAQIRDRAADEYKNSAHALRPHNLYAGQNAGCAYCHSHEGFDARMEANGGLGAVPTYTLAGGKYTYSFSVTPASLVTSNSPGKISCFTCHNGAATDSMTQRTSVVANYKDSVAIVLWASPWNAKWGKIDAEKKSLTCVACHQARPVTYNTTSGIGNNVLDSLLLNDTQLIWDSTKSTTTGNKLSMGWRTGGHYGWPGNIFLGVGYGPSEISGTAIYENSSHTTDASCVGCHMATPTTGSDVSTGEIEIYSTGGHSFSANRSYKGCNVSGCHDLTTGTTVFRNMSASQTYLVALRSTIKNKLDTLGELLKFNGKYLMDIDTVPFNEELEAGNLWWKFTTKHFTGYPDIYDATENKDGLFKATNTSPGAGFNKWPNMTKGQFACLLIFQACVREHSGGVHNPKYTKALLTNAIQYMTAHPF